jgi:hypothetical protein
MHRGRSGSHRNWLPSRPLHPRRRARDDRPRHNRGKGFPPRPDWGAGYRLSGWWYLVGNTAHRVRRPHHPTPNAGSGNPNNDITSRVAHDVPD